MPEKSVLTIGKFDGLHRGHRRIIWKVVELAKRYGWKSVVITLEKNSQPQLATIKEKIILLKKMGIDQIKPLNFLRIKNYSAKKFWEYLKRRWKISWLVIGKDFAFGRGRRGDIRWLKKMARKDGIRLIVVAPLNFQGKKISSQTIRQCLFSGQLAKANYLLGRNYSISGKPVPGLGIARKIGFPTINFRVDKNKLLPQGIFAGYVLKKNGRLPALVYIGASPTLNLARNFYGEIHLLNSKIRNLPDKKITLELVRFRRPEKKFGSISELRQAIISDWQWAKNLFGGVK